VQAAVDTVAADIEVSQKPFDPYMKELFNDL